MTIYLHQNHRMIMQFIKRMKNITWSSAIVDMNAATVFVSSNCTNITCFAQMHQSNSMQNCIADLYQYDLDEPVFNKSRTVTEQEGW